MANLSLIVHEEPAVVAASPQQLIGHSHQSHELIRWRVILLCPQLVGQVITIHIVKSSQHLSKLSVLLGDL